ncbi:hypothetical protein [Dendronalium sp. ChiSLP03b]|uniref:hypothetical protein n=1 Tax=Dendronalium sp. ChiSLP03b TaxID=3075381 RepID=UPI002AD40B2F|nr:hypothetical protein [Dendronalium sp. ChiSLP03b]MDZ8203519.1 hypothetical protein [Dendronalium sp. ChiSLP03b]
MRNEQRFRTVNRILGDRPRLGPFPADQIFPWSLIVILNVFVFNYMLKASWLGTGLSIAWGWATWWVLSSNKDFFGKFVNVPRISRGYMPYRTLKKSGLKGNR